MLNLNWKKNSLNNFICHLSWLEKLSPTHTHPLISICEFSKPYELLFFEFEFWPTPPPPLHDPPHPFMTHSPHPTPPHPWYIFGHKGAFFHGLLHYVSLLWVIIFWVRVTHKMLNVNWEKIHSIILSVTHHGLRNFAPTHTHPLKPIREFLKPYQLLFFELESLVKCWMWLV